MHSLLATNETVNLICVTEPLVFLHQWVTHGWDVLGGAAHPNWDLHYPFFHDEQCAKVMVYTWKFSHDHCRACLSWRLAVRNDLGCHPSLLIVDVHDRPSLLHTITFYHDVDNKSSMSTLLALNLNPTIPTLLIGDFNLHSPSWSEPGLGHSPQSVAFKAWVAGQTFTLDTPTGTITCRGCDNKCPSMLDLMWHNLAMDRSADLTPPLYDWPASLGSDHCGVRSYWVSRGSPLAAPEPLLRTFNPSMDNAASNLWDQCLDTSLPLLWGIKELSTPSLINPAALDLQNAVDTTCSKDMHRKCTPGTHTHSWWTNTCSLVAQAVWLAGDDE